MIQQVITDVYRINQDTGDKKVLGRVIYANDETMETVFSPESILGFTDADLETIAHDMDIVLRAYEGDEELMLQIKGMTELGEEV